jgi:prophage regulatory protein
MSERIELIRLPEVLKRTGLSRSCVYAKCDPKNPQYDPSFPRRRKLSPGPRGAVAWLVSEIEAWLESRPMALNP